MKIIIIEDENLAISRLKRLLNEIENSFEVVAEIKSVKDGLNWFSANADTKVDLIFSDIQLLDGLSFEIFEQIKITIPIIFTTAFDDYLLKAFKTYGIEYLLKPFSVKDMASAISKFKSLKMDVLKYNPVSEGIQTQFFKDYLQPKSPTFISYVREKIVPIKSDDVLYFNLNFQSVYAHTEKSKWLLNESMNQIQEKLSQYHFYRANRQIIVQRKFIKEIENHFGGRLKIQLTADHAGHPEIIISKDNCKSFKDWLQN